MLTGYQHKDQGMENEILAYIRNTKPSETDLKIWISETFCLSFREAARVVEGLQSEGKDTADTGVVT